MRRKRHGSQHTTNDTNAEQWQGEAQPKASRAHSKEKLPVAAGTNPNTHTYRSFSTK